MNIYNKLDERTVVDRWKNEARYRSIEGNAAGMASDIYLSELKTGINRTTEATSDEVEIIQ